MRGEVFHTQDGEQLRYEFTTTGAAEATVVFLNASFLDHHQWNLLASRLGRVAAETRFGIDTLFMDYRGFGEVTPLSRPITFNAIQQDVLDLLDKKGIRGDVRITSSSLGSLIGLSLLEREPRRFSSMVVYGLVAPEVSVIRHVREVFSLMASHLHSEPTLDGAGRLDESTIAPFARAMWEVFVVQYSRTPAAVKARGITDAYASYILKYMRGTPASTIGSFLDLVSNEALESSTVGARFSPVTLQKVSVFQGTDDLVTPFMETKAFCDRAGVRSFNTLEKKGHTDFIFDGAVCDALSRAILY